MTFLKKWKNTSLDCTFLTLEDFKYHPLCSYVSVCAHLQDSVDEFSLKVKNVYISTPSFEALSYKLLYP